MPEKFTRRKLFVCSQMPTFIWFHVYARYTVEPRVGARMLWNPKVWRKMSDGFESSLDVLQSV